MTAKTVKGDFTVSEYILLYRETVEGRQQRTASPDRGQEEMKKWQAWFKDMTDKGQLKTLGQPLEPAGKIVEGKKKTITDGPFSETKDVIGGYSIIAAKDLDEAAQIASGCPILDSNGKVEVRPVRQM
jgi:hypothetical protein